MPLMSVGRLPGVMQFLVLRCVLPLRTVLSMVLSTRLYIPLGRFLAMDLDAKQQSLRVSRSTVTCLLLVTLVEFRRVMDVLLFWR